MAKRKPAAAAPPRRRRKSSTPAAIAEPPAKPRGRRPRAEPRTEDPPFDADPDRESAAYERHKRRTARRQRLLAQEGAEIGPIPDVEDPARRKSCARNLRLYLEIYHPETFRNPWSEAQLDLIKRCERAILHGGLCAVAYPRGEGKSSIVECALLWAILYGHHRYVFVLKSTDDKFAQESLDSLKAELESNELLLADFPEVCYPIACLEGTAQRAAKQTCEGQRTHIGWKGSKRIIFPTIAGSVSSGAVIGGSGLTGKGIRGSRFKRRVDGKTETLRPTLVIADDVQDDESAANPEATAKIKRLMNGAVLGMAGPDGRLAVLFPCTIIAPGDLADELTDREKSPEWKGLRLPLLLAWPADMELWEEWYDLRKKELRGDDDLDDEESDPAPRATAWLRERFAAAHAGAEVINPHRKLAWQVSAVHQAMTLYFRDPISFWSEYQNWITDRPNSPTPPSSNEELRLDPYGLARKCSGYPRGTFPADVRWLTAFVDVQHRVLYWMVCGWQQDFTGYVIDYGTFPETKRASFSASTFRPTLKERYEGQSQEGALTAGLTELTADLLARDWKREDDVRMQIERCMVDAGDQTATIKRWIAASPLKARLLHSFGRDVGPNDWPMEEWKPRPGEVKGDDWILRPPTKGNRHVRHMVFNTFYWKTFAARRLKAAAGDPGCVTLPSGRGGEQLVHEHLAQHLTSEQAHPTEGQKQKVDIWIRRPGVTETHWWDGFVGNCVLGSHLGAKLGGATPREQQKERRSLADLRRAKRRRAA